MAKNVFKIIKCDCGKGQKVVQYNCNKKGKPTSQLNKIGLNCENCGKEKINIDQTKILW